MIRSSHHILKGFIIASFLLSCRDSDYSKQVSLYPEIKVADNWTIKLPYNLKETELSHLFYQRIFTSPNDSITLGIKTRRFTIEDGINQFSDIVENEKQGKVDGPCMGASKGSSKNYNFIDSANMLSGVITDYEENGQREIQFNVISAKTGESLSLGFEKLSSKNVKIIHEVINSIRNHR